MERTQSECRTLPEELVQRIVAMMPFPSIFKARTLSKSWRSRFSPVSSIDDEEERCSAISFQKQVRERSHKWETFCPVSFGERLGSAYDNTFRNGSKCLPSLSFVPAEIFSGLLDLQGPLLCGHTDVQKPDMSELSELRLFVANILTKSWKQLPRLRARYRYDMILWKKIVRAKSLDTYYVIVLSLDVPAERGCFLHTYDSKSGAWISTDFGIDDGNDLYACDTPPTYFNGVLYMPGIDRFLVLNVQKGTWERIMITPLADDLDMEPYLVACGKNLLRIELLVGGFIDYRGRRYHHGRLVDIDLPSKNVFIVQRDPRSGFTSPRAVRKRDMSLKPFSDGQNVFVGSRNQLGRYNVKEDQWSWFNFHHQALESLVKAEEAPENSVFCFQPGLNPFAEV